MRCSHYSSERHCKEKLTKPVLIAPGLAIGFFVLFFLFFLGGGLTQRLSETGKHSRTAWLAWMPTLRYLLFMGFNVLPCNTGGNGSTLHLSWSWKLGWYVWKPWTHLCCATGWWSTVVSVFWSNQVVTAKGRQLSGCWSELAWGQKCHRCRRMGRCRWCDHSHGETAMGLEERRKGEMSILRVDG